MAEPLTHSENPSGIEPAHAVIPIEVPERPVEEGVAFVRQGVRVNCPGEKGYEIIQASRKEASIVSVSGTSKSFLDWGCKAVRAESFEHASQASEPFTFCSLRTDYRKLHEGTYLYADESSLVECRYSSLAPKQGYDFVFKNKIGDKSTFYCRKNSDLTEFYYWDPEHRGDWIAFQSNVKGETLEGAFDRIFGETKLQAALTAHRQPDSKKVDSLVNVTAVGAGWSAACESVNGRTRGCCSILTGKCEVEIQFDQENWNLQSKFNRGYLKCSGNRGRLESLSSEVDFLFNEKIQTRMAAELAPKNGWGVGARLLFERGNAYFRYSPNGTLSPESLLGQRRWAPSDALTPLSNDSRNTFILGAEYRY